MPIEVFAKALQAEGVSSGVGANNPMHLHPLYNSVDVYGDGVPTRIAGAADGRADVRYEALPATERSQTEVFSVPWFKHDEPEAIEMYANAFKKVCAHASELMAAATAEAEVSAEAAR